jgi:hypothetical protein
VSGRSNDTTVVRWTALAASAAIFCSSVVFDVEARTRLAARDDKPAPRVVEAPLAETQVGGERAESLLATLEGAPLLFEPNVGQTDERVEFLCRLATGTLFLTGDSAVFSLGRAPVRPEPIVLASGGEVGRAAAAGPA